MIRGIGVVTILTYSQTLNRVRNMLFPNGTHDQKLNKRSVSGPLLVSRTGDMG